MSEAKIRSMIKQWIDSLPRGRNIAPENLPREEHLHRNLTRFFFFFMAEYQKTHSRRLGLSSQHFWWEHRGESGWAMEEIHMAVAQYAQRNGGIEALARKIAPSWIDECGKLMTGTRLEELGRSQPMDKDLSDILEF